MTSPCGAAGIEMLQLMSLCGCKKTEPHFEMEKVHPDYFWPFLFGDLPMETMPEWLNGVQIHSFTFDKTPIRVSLAVALLLHPDLGFVTIKDPSSGGQSLAPGAALRSCLLNEAGARRDRLKDIFGPKEEKDEAPAADALGLVAEPSDEELLLSIPMEIFMTSFDELPHLSAILRFLICEEQLPGSVANLEILDPRLPTRITRPPPPKTPNPLLMPGSHFGKKRSKPPVEEWGGMKFYCPATNICTMTAQAMRQHMQGDLYKRIAASTPGWEDSSEKKDLLQDLEEADMLQEQAKRARRALGPPMPGGLPHMNFANKGRGKGRP